jgi:type II secretory pathway component PulJ
MRYKGNLVLLELLIALAFFAVSAVIGTGVLARAYKIDLDSRRTTDALFIAQGWAERIAAAEDPLARAGRGGNAGRRPLYAGRGRLHRPGGGDAGGYRRGHALRHPDQGLSGGRGTGRDPGQPVRPGGGVALNRAKQEYRVGIGASTMLTIFVVLCVATLALLALSGARGDAALTSRAKEMTLGYYRSSDQAQRILAQVDAAVRRAAKAASGEGAFEEELSFLSLDGVSLVYEEGILSFNVVPRRAHAGCGGQAVDAGGTVRGRSVPADGRRALDGGERFAEPCSIDAWGNDRGLMDLPGRVRQGRIGRLTSCRGRHHGQGRDAADAAVERQAEDGRNELAGRGRLRLTGGREVSWLSKKGDDDFSFSVRDVGRFRCNTYKHAVRWRRCFGGALRPARLQGAGIPQVVMDLCAKRRGWCWSRARPAAASPPRWPA